MPLSNEFYDYLAEISKIKHWEQLPKEDPRIVKLQTLAKLSEKEGSQAEYRKRVTVSRNGVFYKAYRTAVEAGKELGMTAEAVRKVARGERNPLEGWEIKYLKG